MDIDLVKDLYGSKRIKWSVHCVERLQERDISIDDVEIVLNLEK